jgi:two-component system, LytTR family, response regulator
MSDDAVRALIVDDEPLAREGVRLLLERDPQVVVVGECADGASAVETITRLRPDLVFLDVQMPEMSGFEVLSALELERLPAVVFVTAYDHYALEAFEVHALDYLLKPFEDERFFAALRRAKEHLRQSRMNELSQRLIALLESQGPAVTGARRVRRIAVKSAGRTVFLEVDDIDWIEAADYYVQLHVGPQSYLHRQSMTSLEQELDPDQFLRIHRSAIVNRERIRELRQHGRDVLVVLQGGTELKVARGHREKLQSLL